MYDVARLRKEEFPHSDGQIYLHHAGISPIPQRTKNAMITAVTALADNPGRYWGQTLMPMLDQFHEDLCSFLNAAEKEEFAIITTTSYGINALALAIDWQPGDNIAFCDVEFPSNAYPWMRLQREGVVVRQVTAVNGGLTLEALQAVVDENTRLVAASAIQFLSGHQTDLQAIGNFCHERGILFAVDAIQSIGHMPIDVRGMHIDMLATGGQKSLLAPPGIGFLYVRRAVAEQMTPRVIGANSTVDYLHWLNYDLTPLPGAARFNGGTYNVPGIAGMVASLSLLRELGVAAIGEHTRGLTAVTAHLLTTAGFHVITPIADGCYGPICTFASGLSSADTDALVIRLAQRGITVCKHLDAAGNAFIRVSFHAYNTEAEAHQFVEALVEETGKS